MAAWLESAAPVTAQRVVSRRGGKRARPIRAQHALMNLCDKGLLPKAASQVGSRITLPDSHILDQLCNRTT